MKSNSITFDFKLPTLNEYINVNRANKRGGNALKQSTEKKLCYIIAASHLKINKSGLFDLSLNWETINNRKDPDNIYFGIKFILDALVKMQIIEKDGRKNIRHISNKIYTTGRDAVTIELHEKI